MPLDAKFMIAPSLQEYFVDKTTGLPLANGMVYFYSDVNRTTLKAIYTLNGAPPYSDASYMQLPNPVPLSAVGTFTDGNGNDVLPYYYPFDSNGSIELYYIAVFSSTSVPQFTREAYPNLTSLESSAIDITNFVPNGQFLIHNNNQTALAQLASTGIDYKPIAQGGWYFARSHGSTATDLITFPIFQNYVNLPLNASPRFSCNVQRTVASNDSVCDLRIRFNDVNKFTSTTEIYYLLFTAQSNSGATQSVNINVYYYYGSGTNSPSSPVTTAVETITVPTSETSFQIPIIFGTNTGKTIGNNNDDFVEICMNIAETVSSTSNIQFTDFILTPNNSETISQFPTTTTSEFIYQSIFGGASIPDYTGRDLYLPAILTPSGMSWDHSGIGKISSAIYSSSYSTANNFPQLLCDNTGYIYGNYSTIGIPYARLGDVLIANSPISNTPMYGTGTNFATAYAVNGSTSRMRLTVNKAGVAALAADVSSGLSFSNIHTGAATINYTAINTAANTIICLGSFLNTANAAADGGAATGFTIVNSPIPTQMTSGNYSFSLVAVVPPASSYFIFSNASINYYMWFKVDGVGTDPAVGGKTGIEVDILSTYTAQDVANCVREAISGYQMSLATVGAVPGASTYWTFQTNPGALLNYYVWYKVSGVGVDPAPASKIGIEVDVLSGDTNAQVITKTLTAINKYQYAVPGFQGMFLRGYDPNSTWDIDSASRWSTVTALSGNVLGTYEFSQLLAHKHTSLSGANFAVNSGNSLWHSTGLEGGSNDATTANTGGTETRPVNAYVNFFINY